MEDSVNYPLVSPKRFIKEFLYDKLTVIVDCRWDLLDKKKGYREYIKAHIPGAIYADMENDLSDMSRDRAGRHPMPGPEKFKRFAENLGVTEDTRVVAYDIDGSGASRLWFLMYFYGHKNSYILDGGLNAYLREGGTLTDEIPRLERKGRFNPVESIDIIVRRDDIKQKRHNVVDAREPHRYRGESEMIDRIAGHIPGAKNLPYTLFIKDGKFKSAQEVKDILSGVGKDPVFYCGSGVTACVPFVASMIAGVKARIYPGSWSEWISYEDTDVETGDVSSSGKEL